MFNKSKDTLFCFPLAIVVIAGCMPDANTASKIDFGDASNDSGVEGADADAQQDVQPDIVDESVDYCDSSELYRTVEGFYVGRKPRFSDAPGFDFIVAATVLDSSDTLVEFELEMPEPKGRLRVLLPQVEGVNYQLPNQGEVVEVAFSCSPGGTWCENDAYLAVFSSENRLLFEGGQIRNIESMSSEVLERFSLRLDSTPSGESCMRSKENADGVLCERSAKPIHLLSQLANPLVPDGEHVVTEINGQSYLLSALKVRDITHTCPSTDVILGASYGYLVLIEE